MPTGSISQGKSINHSRFAEVFVNWALLNQNRIPRETHAQLLLSAKLAILTRTVTKFCRFTNVVINDCCLTSSLIASGIYWIHPIQSKTNFSTWK
ncbi:hypothetical protein GRJ2_000154500 [Grus japonensis]|uniref:Uncharacterized protein n=1 Tax=Grus japonensis TaxID=30415 RepID=A0ABC9VVM9_GRUJA